VYVWEMVRYDYSVVPGKECQIRLEILVEIRTEEEKTMESKSQFSSVNILHALSQSLLSP
jgi:hypothetical protein